MKHRFIKILCFVICISNVFAFLMIPASANSAQTEWSGKDSSGAAVMGGDCPIVVTNEVLTFDINVLPKYRHPSAEDYVNYDAKVTAEYTFYNPSDITVTAKLVFPFDSKPAYFTSAAGKDDGENSNTNRYQITVNGTEVDRKMRYTVGDYGGFDFDHELASLSDEYITDEFFKPNTLVTKYTYYVPEVSGSRKAYVAFDFANNNRNTRIYMPGASVEMKKDGSMRLYKYADTASSFDFYVFGTPLSTPPVFRMYPDYNVKDGEELNVPINFVSTSIMTLEGLVLAKWNENSKFSRVDWYNALVTGFMDGTVEDNFISAASKLNPESYNNVIEWYEYEITLAPGESIVNKVTAPMYPDVNAGFRPEIYTYNYYLTPAKTWASFGNLQIIINTPYYMLDNSIGDFTKTENGYMLNLSGLPDRDLKFILSESEDPETRSGTKWSTLQRRAERREAIKEFITEYKTYLGIGAGVTLLTVAFIVVKKNNE